jgi:hypothetical protein
MICAFCTWFIFCISLFLSIFLFKDFCILALDSTMARMFPLHTGISCASNAILCVGGEAKKLAKQSLTSPGKHLSGYLEANEVNSYSGWAWKRKSQAGKGRLHSLSRLMNQSNKRFFTVDFQKEQFYYQNPASSTMSEPCSFDDLLSAYAVSAPEAGRSLGHMLGWNADYDMEGTPGPNTEFGICVQTRQKEFELYFATSADVTRWLQVFERALLLVEVRQDADGRIATMAPSAAVNLAASGCGEDPRVIALLQAAAEDGSTGMETVDTACISATPTEALDENGLPDCGPQFAHSQAPNDIYTMPTDLGDSHAADQILAELDGITEGLAQEEHPAISLLSGSSHDNLVKDNAQGPCDELPEDDAPVDVGIIQRESNKSWDYARQKSWD